MKTPIIVGRTYRHYKNKLYRVIGLAKHSETLEDMVVYESLYENKVSKLWIRPKTMFEEEIIIDGVLTPRFTLVTTR